MGLFDKFRKKVLEAAEDTDLEEISAEADSEEAEAALALRESIKTPAIVEQPTTIEEKAEEEWEEFDEDEDLQLPESTDDEWDDWDDEDGN